MTYLSEQLADSPLVVYPLDETFGSVAADATGNGRAGSYGASGLTLGVPSLLTDGSGFACDFLGQTDSVAANGSVTTAAAAWMNVSTFTLEALIQPDAESLVSTYKMIGSRDGGLSADRILGMSLHSGRLVGTVWTDGSVKESFLSPAGSITAGSIYHVAVTWDGSTLRGYINGAETGTFAASGTIHTSATTPLTVARSHREDPGYNRFNGRIQGFGFYGSALSGTRVAAHSTAAFAAAASGGDLTLAGTAPAATAAFNLTHAAAPVNLTLAGVAPLAVASFALDNVPAEIDLTLAGTAPAATASFVLDAETFTTDLTLAGVAPTATAAFLLDAPAPPTQGTDTFNRANGRSRTGKGYANLDEPVTPKPDTIHAEPIRIMAQTLSTPTLEKGRPV